MKYLLLKTNTVIEVKKEKFPTTDLYRWAQVEDDLEVKAGQFYYNGEVLDYDPSFPIERSHAKIHLEINKKRDSILETEPFDLGVFSIDVNSLARQNLSGKLSELIADETVENVSWISADNQILNLTRSEFFDMYSKIVQHTQHIFMKARLLKDEVSAISDKKTLSEYKIPENWLEI